MDQPLRRLTKARYACSMKLVVRLLLIAATLSGACRPTTLSTTATNTPSLIESSPSPAYRHTPALIPASTTPKALPAATRLSSATPLQPSPTANPQPVTSLLFTGVISPSRCVQAKIDQLGNPDYPYEEVRHLLQEADLTIGVFNATMSTQIEHTGCVPTFQLVGSPDNADALQRAGFDLMSVATNHIKDCGLMKAWCDKAFYETIYHLQRVGILTVGAGDNLAEALRPVSVPINDIRFAFVSLGDSKLSETVFATENHPGIARLTEENARRAIAMARQAADVVIALPHWGSEYNLLPNWNQRLQAQYLVAAGADLVVGNHTHVAQAYQQIDNVMVFYGLGNFVFDQQPRETQQGVILIVRFLGSQFLDYVLIATHIDGDGRVHLANPEEAQEILERLHTASKQLH